MNRSAILILAAGAALLASCGGSGNDTKNQTSQDTAKAQPMPPVSLDTASASPEFANATLGVSAKAEKAGNDSARVTFTFDVKNYDLKAQTADNTAKSCANSKDGQHIHFILDNKPYKALYEPKNEITLANGTEHYLMAFLSRSYHESVKSKGAAVLYHFSIDKNGVLKTLPDPKTPMLFYSRPKGDYIGADTTNLLLDFYVWNCNLSAADYKVKAEINNIDRPSQQLTTTVDKWAPHIIHNLGTGKSKVTLTLIDKDGKPLEGNMGSITREFNLAAQEPMKK